MKENLLNLLENNVSGLGYELVHFEFSSGDLLRVFIDKPEGITVDDCEKVSKHLTRLFAVENVDYSRLEVSSPGLDRVLRKASDFERFTGCQIKVRLREPIEGLKVRAVVGVLLGIEQDQISVRSDQGDVTFHLDQLHRAHLVPSVKW